MDKKKKNLLVIPSTLLVLSAVCYGGYEYSKKDNNSSNSLVQNVKEVKKIAYAEKESTIVVTASLKTATLLFTETIVILKKV